MKYSSLFEATLGTHMPRSASGRINADGTPAYSSAEREREDKRRAAEVEKRIILNIMDGFNFGDFKTDEDAMAYLTETERMTEDRALALLNKAKAKRARLGRG